MKTLKNPRLKFQQPGGGGVNVLKPTAFPLVFSFALVLSSLVGIAVFRSPAQAAFPGVNGKIAFVRWGGVGGGNPDIYTMGPDGTGLRQLTSNGQNAQPAWSADGAKLAFTCRLGICTMNSDGTGVVALTVGSSSRWQDSSPTWSPDGSRIAFTREFNDQNSWPRSEIWVIGADGTNPINLTSSPGRVFDLEPAWSPDGRRIAFVSNRGTPGGGIRDVWVMNSDGTRMSNLTPGPTNNYFLRDYAPNWSPDGTKIAFVSNRDDPEIIDGLWCEAGPNYGQSPTPCNTEIYVMNRDGSGQQRLTNYGGADELPAWSPDGSMIAFTRDGRNGSIFAVSPDGSTITNYGVAGYDPDWQPLAWANLGIAAVTESSDPVGLNFPLTYTVFVNNFGGTATEARLTHALPAGVNFVSARASQGSCTYDSGDNFVLCNLGAVPTRWVVRVDIVVQPTVIGNINATFWVSSPNPDPNPINNSWSESTQVVGADLWVTMTDSPDPVEVGGTLNYQIRVGNFGPDTATNVLARFAVPTGTTLQGLTTDYGGCSNTVGTITCTWGTHPSGLVITINAGFRVDRSGSIYQRVVVSSRDVGDPNGTNNIADASTRAVVSARAASADLKLTVTDHPDPVVVNHPLTYTLHIKNFGPNPVGEVVLNDSIPIDFTFVSATASHGSCWYLTGDKPGAVFICNFPGAIAVSHEEHAIITIIPRIVGTITSYARVFALLLDPDLGNNAVTVTTEVTSPP